MRFKNATSGFQAFCAGHRAELLAAVLLMGCQLAHAVAGGAGGGGSGGGDAGFSADSPELLIFEIIVWILVEVPFPYNVLILGAPVLAFLILMLRESLRSARFAKRSASNPKKTASAGIGKTRHRLKRLVSWFKAAPKPLPLPADIVAPKYAFDGDALLAKARIAFPAIQQAWSAEDLTSVRRWISDGIWQRFNTQFAMMRLLQQRNLVGHLEIRRIFIDDAERDGPFDIAHVAIQFSAQDDFICQKFPQLDQRGHVEMTEYWSFVRRRGVAAGDLYGSNRCPSCGAELPADLGEVARCASCGAVSTLGDYDWVLSEITQADDYRNRSGRFAKGGTLASRIRAALALGDDFSVQLIEDKASNAYMQIMAARATGRVEMLRRFVDDPLFRRLAEEFTGQPPVVFNRLYMNSVTLVDFFRAAGRDNLVVAFRYTAQRIDGSSDRLRLIDHGPYARDEIMILSRDVGAGQPKGFLYAHTCPACGGPVGDTLDVRCQYCGEVINSTRHEWIVTALLTKKEYESRRREKRTMAVAYAS